MTGRPLCEMRDRIDELSTADGTYGVVCGRTGERVVPLVDARFADRASASEAARLAEAYRAVLRRYDPRLAFHDLIVREMPALPTSATARAVNSER